MSLAQRAVLDFGCRQEGHHVKTPWGTGPMPLEEWKTHRARIDEWSNAFRASPGPRQPTGYSADLEAAVERSRRIYGLEDDWDGEGTAGYERETWERAVGFLRLHAKKFIQETGRPIPAPSIGPGPDGSIDIYWKEASFGLLVNVPPDGDSPARFYGEDEHLTIEGSIRTSDYQRGILHWLATR